MAATSQQSPSIPWATSKRLAPPVKNLGSLTRSCQRNTGTQQTTITKKHIAMQQIPKKKTKSCQNKLETVVSASIPIHKLPVPYAYVVSTCNLSRKMISNFSALYVYIAILHACISTASSHVLLQIRKHLTVALNLYMYVAIANTGGTKGHKIKRKMCIPQTLVVKCMRL